jgi:hypothetical protein
MRTPWQRAAMFLGLSLALGLVMVTGDSLWIDEGQTWHFARQPSLAAWLRELLHSSRSEAQMPLGMLQAWLGGKFLGLGEWQMRAVNLPWIALAGLAMGLIGHKLKNRFALALFLAHPFLWLYADEARPYAMQICAGAWLLWVWLGLQQDSVLTAGNTRLLASASCVGLGASLLFAFPLLAVFSVTALARLQGKFRLQGGWRCRVPLAVLGLALILLSGYFVFTLRAGAGGARSWAVSPLNLVFCVYEAFGFSGLGPPRAELRELARVPARLMAELAQPGYAAGLGLFGLVCLALLRRIWQERHDWLVRRLVLVLVLGSGLLYGAAAAARFPFWGRHLAGLLPWVVVLMARAAAPPPGSAAWLKPGWSQGLLAAALIFGLGASSLIVRFGQAYRKDDYRTASALAQQALAAGEIVWWAADSEDTAAYYFIGRKQSPGGEQAHLVLCAGQNAEQLLAGPAPALVLLSKPDLYDSRGAVTSYLASHHYLLTRRLPAFTVWRPPLTPVKSAAH